MADDLPDALAMREVKYGEKTPRERRLKVARDLVAAGRIYEALDLFLIAKDEEGVRGLRTRATKEGLPVILLMLRRAGQAPTAAEWSAAGEGAFAAGRYRDAFRCFLEANDAAGLERVRERLPGYELYTPAGK